MMLPQPADAYSVSAPFGGVFTSDSVLSTIKGPFEVIGGTVFNLDLAFATYVEVADPPPPNGTAPEPFSLLTWGGLAVSALAVGTCRRHRDV
jgi:hypothetical protein